MFITLFGSLKLVGTTSPTVMGPYMVSAVVKGPVELAAHATMDPSNEYFLFSPFPSYLRKVPPGPFPLLLGKSFAPYSRFLLLFFLGILHTEKLEFLDMDRHIYSSFFFAIA